MLKQLDGSVKLAMPVDKTGDVHRFEMVRIWGVFQSTDGSQTRLGKQNLPPRRSRLHAYGDLNIFSVHHCRVPRLVLRRHLRNLVLSGVRRTEYGEIVTASAAII
jgi:hypothetical protein